MERKIKVLIADSNESFAAVLSELLGKEGDLKIVGTTGDGLHAVRLISEIHPDIVLTDLVLSGVDGFGLLEKASKLPLPSRPKIIMVSGFANSHIVTMAETLGAAYFIQKPCDPDFLLSRIRMLMECDASVASTGTQTTLKGPGGTTAYDCSITSVLHEFGIPAHIKGYHYLRESILKAVENPDMITGVTKELYPVVAKKYHTTSVCVERAIRHAIGVAWNRGNIDLLQHYFGCTASSTGRPTNSVFIAMIADMLSHGNMMEFQALHRKIE